MTMNHRAGGWIRFVNSRMCKRFGRRNCDSLAFEPIPHKIVSNHFRVMRRHQLRDPRSCRACDVEARGRAVPDTYISEADAAGIHADHSKSKKFAPVSVQLGESGEAGHLHRHLL